MQSLSFALMSDPFCVLLAGGRGTRLHELTLAECKPAVAFGGGRLVDFTLANARRSGLRQMLVATQYLPGALVAHLGTVWQPRFGAALQIRDGAAAPGRGYRGTADVLRANLPEILASGAREVIILSADHVYAMDYRPMIAAHRASTARVTVAVALAPLAEARQFGVLSCASGGRITAFSEKPRHPQPVLGDPGQARVSLGLYVIDTAWLVEALAQPGMDDFGHDILPGAVAQGVAQAHHAAGAEGCDFYWRDVGTLESYRRGQLDFMQPTKAPFTPPIPTPIPSREACLAAERGSVLLPGAGLGRHSRVSNAILATGVQVPYGLVIGEDPDEDRRWFRVVPGGPVLVTAAMLRRRSEERRRPLAIGWSVATAGGY